MFGEHHALSQWRDNGVLLTFPPRMSRDGIGGSQRAGRFGGPDEGTAASPGDRWLEVFARALSDLFPGHFGDVDWGLQFDRAGLTVTAGDRLGGSSVTVQLPTGHAELNAWLLAGDLLMRLRQMAEELGFLQPRA